MSIGACPDGRHRPRRLKELTSRLDQIGSSGPHLLRIAHQQRRAGRQMVGQQRRFSRPQQGVSASMPSTAMPSASLASMSLTLPVTWFSSPRGVLRQQLRRVLPHLGGEEQLTARQRHNTGFGDVDLGDRPLIGHREHPHLGDLVAPELHPDRMFGGWGNTSRIPPRTANSPRFATINDVGAGKLHQPGYDTVEVEFGPTDNATGAMSPMSGDIGCNSDRTVVTTAFSGGPSRASSGFASRRNTIIRAPTVSTPGDSRSCGSVSHDGNNAASAPYTPRSSAVRSSASRPVAVTTNSGPA